MTTAIETTGPVGLAGWLILIGLRLVIGLVVVLGQVLALNEEGEGQYVALIIFSVQALLLFFYLGQRKEFVTAYVLANSGMLIFFGWVALLRGSAESLGELVGLAIGEAPFMAYVLFSKRVRNTFVRGE